MIILITGSRKFTDRKLMRSVLSKYPSDTKFRVGDVPKRRNIKVNEHIQLSD